MTIKTVINQNKNIMNRFDEIWFKCGSKQKPFTIVKGFCKLLLLKLRHQWDSNPRPAHYE